MCEISVYLKYNLLRIEKLYVNGHGKKSSRPKRKLICGFRIRTLRVELFCPLIDLLPKINFPFLGSSFSLGLDAIQQYLYSSIYLCSSKVGVKTMKTLFNKFSANLPTRICITIKHKIIFNPIVDGIQSHFVIISSHCHAY